LEELPIFAEAPAYDLVFATGGDALLEQAFSVLVEEFLAVYPSYIEEVKPALNGLFREEDYLSVTKLRKKFGLKLEVLPIPSGDDFRVTMSEEERARVSREIDENVRKSLQRGRRTCGSG
jgi:hypothetical protein